MRYLKIPWNNRAFILRDTPCAGIDTVTQFAAKITTDRSILPDRSLSRGFLQITCINFFPTRTLLSLQLQDSRQFSKYLYKFSQYKFYSLKKKKKLVHSHIFYIFIFFMEKVYIMQKNFSILQINSES